ncbi:hypothetical protein C0Q70_18424 [Pomacea canaliculata]|uniref:Ig-like domain-containing protein n=1 Tax=Pomacea canaliculata TaxID=400727 RepID=A0A2T7NN66_POMCA|nr:hypothetical protein C0Q70_18424 [Pomacea canaliculata]
MISNELTLEIPRVSTKDIGRYACKLSNMNPKDIKPCELKIKLVGKTMCDVPPVPLSSRASLTCYFPEDLSKTRANFRVHHGANCSDPACAVVTCEWGDNLVCSILRGYHFDLTVTSHLTVGIPTAQEEQEGSYSCYFTSSTPVLYEPCSLTLVTVTSSCSISRVTETEPASLTCTFNVDVNETRNNFSLVRFGGGDSKGVDIVTCTWLEDQLKCTTAPGYEVNNLVTDRLVIRVPRASRDHTGTYACHVTDSKASGFQPCEFILKPGVAIVTCTWLQDQLKCTTAPGYEVNNLVTDRLVIRVPRASRDHTGTYACHVTGSSMDGFKSCDFILIPDVPAVVLTVAIAVLMFIPLSLVIIFLVFKCKQRKEVDQKATKQVSSEETSLISPEEKISSSPPVLLKEEISTEILLAASAAVTCDLGRDCPTRPHIVTHTT